MPRQSLDLLGIRKGFGQTQVLKNINLSVQEGEFISLVGMSGCGKSTLLRILAGLETPDEGEVRIGGQDVTKRDPSDRNLAMVFQSYALYPHMTVGQNIATPLRMRKLGFAARLPLIGRIAAPRAALDEIDAAVASAAETLQIAHLLDRKPAQLSGGQRQRVALARALVRQPAAFLMDEPLSNLDAKLRAHMRSELVALHRRLGATFVYVTHDQVEAMTMSDRIALMIEGRIEQLGTPDDLYHAPATLAVAKFIGSPTINLLPVEVPSCGTLRIKGADAAMTAAPGPATLGIRAEDVFVAKSGMTARILHGETHGPDRFVTCEVLDGQQKIVLRQKASDPVGADADGHMTLGFAAGRAHLFGADGLRRKMHLAEQVAA